MEIGDKVKVKGPFSPFFTSEYHIIEIINNPDGTIVYILDQDIGGFDIKYLEKL